MAYIFVSPLIYQLGRAVGIAGIAGGVALIARYCVLRFLPQLTRAQRINVMRALYAVILIGSIALAATLTGSDGAWLLATILFTFWVGALFGPEKRLVMPSVRALTKLGPLHLPSALAEPMSATSATDSAAPTKMEPVTTSVALVIEAPPIDIVAGAPMPEPVAHQQGKLAQLSSRPPLGKRTIKVLQTKH